MPACLECVLGGSVSSRLFQEVREKRGLVYSIYSFFVDVLGRRYDHGVCRHAPQRVERGRWRSCAVNSKASHERALIGRTWLASRIK